MAAMSRYLLPAILRTVSLPTRSALGKWAFISAKFSQRSRRVACNHARRGPSASGYFTQNARNFFLEITCTRYRLPKNGSCQDRCKAEKDGTILQSAALPARANWPGRDSVVVSGVVVSALRSLETRIAS